MIKKLYILFLLMFVFSFSFTTNAQVSSKLNDIESQTKDLSYKISNLQNKFLSTNKSVIYRRIEDRIADAEMFFKLRDYLSSSIIYLDLVENYPNNPGFSDALFYLAESLYFARDYLGARNRYIQIIQHGNDPDFSQFIQTSLSRLIEISVRLREFEGLENYLSMLEKSPNQQFMETIEFMRGKYYYFQDDLAKASNYFDRIQSNSEFYPHSQYFLGVIYTKNNDYTKAIEYFSRSAKITPQDVEQRKVSDLSKIALGSLYLELDRYDDSIKAYEEVGRDSTYFDTALYEAAWVSIQSGDPIKAERMLEIISVSNPDSVHIPEVKMLRGQLLVEAGRFDEAEKNFKNLIEQFTPVYEKLQKISKEQTDMKTYFNEIVRANMESYQINSFLPPIVLRWVSMDESVNNSLSILEDISKCNSYISDSEKVLLKLKLAMSGEYKHLMLSDIRRGYQAITENLNLIINLKSNLTNLEEKLYGSSDNRLSSLIKQRKAIESKLAELPTSTGDYDEFDKAAKEQYIDLKRQLSTLRVNVTELRAKVVAIDLYIQQLEEKNQGNNIDKSALESELNLHNKAIKIFENEIDQIQSFVDAGVIQANLGGVELENFEKLSKEYQSVLEEEKRLLANKIGSQYANRIERSWIELSKLENQLKGLKTQLEIRGNKEFSKIEEVLGEEGRNFSSYKTQIAQLQSDAEDIIGSITFQSFQNVVKKFDDLIMQAEVGITDVAWAEREEHVGRVKLLSSERELKLQMLDDEYNEVMDIYSKQR